ncbi:MAG: T9SS type A sorting domain-containing protein [Saprospiraceae bacterium]|nr:T9SS type A sorting domain-containing protein [Saprospiraceae bacterium]
MLWKIMMTKNRKVVAGKTASMSMLMLGWFFILLTPGLSQTQVEVWPGGQIVTISGLPDAPCGATIFKASLVNVEDEHTNDKPTEVSKLNDMVAATLAEVPPGNRIRLQNNKHYEMQFKSQGLSPAPWNKDNDTVPYYFPVYHGIESEGLSTASIGSLLPVRNEPGEAESIWKADVFFPNGTTDGYVVISFRLGFVFGPIAYNVVIPFVVEGPTEVDVPVPILDTIVEPQMPYLILHAPPGDGSSSEFQTSKTICRNLETNITSAESHAANLAVKLGIAGQAGLFVTTSFEFSVTFSAGLEAGNLEYTTSSNQTCITVNEGFSTSRLVDAQGGGDVFVGYGTDLALGVYPLVQFDESTCTAIRTKGLVYAPVGKPRHFILTKKGIEDNIGELEIKLKDSARLEPRQSNALLNQINVWKQVLALNLENINNADNEVLESNLTLTSGAKLERQESIQTTQTSTIKYEQYIDAKVGVQAVVEVAGSGISGGYEFKASKKYGASQNLNLDQSKLVKYTLNDDDIGDKYNLTIVRDPMFGTPIFRLNEGTRSSCPYQGGYQRDRPKLLFANGSDTMTISNAPTGTRQTFQIKVCNDSDEPRTYYLKGNSASNLNGASIEGFGNKLFNTNDDGVDFYLIPAKSCLDEATLSIMQANNEVYDYNNIELYLYSLCQPAEAPIASSIYLNVHYVPTTGVNDLAAEGVGLKIAPNPNKGHFSVELNGFHEEGLLSIADLSGRTVYRRMVKSGEQRFEFQSQQFFPGLYLVTLQNDRGRLTRKLVVQR